MAGIPTSAAAGRPAANTDDYERQRFAHLVLGAPRPKPGRNKARKGKAPTIVRLAPGIEEQVAQRERWSHKAFGTLQDRKSVV